MKCFISPLAVVRKVFAVLVFLLLNFLSGKGQVYPSRGVVAYYPFSGNANDASGNNIHPVFNNAVLSTDRFGRPNETYKFNGIDNYMRIPNHPRLNVNASQLAISVWVKVDGFTEDCGGSNILIKGSRYGDAGSYHLKFDNDHATNGQGCSQPAGLQPQNFGARNVKPMVAPEYIQPGKWYHIVYNCNNAYATLYINCNLVSSGPVDGSVFVNGADLFLGRVNNALFPGWFNGELDELRIYDRGLTSDEIASLGDCGSATQSACNRMLALPSIGSRLEIGDADISGDKLTVEAVFNMTGNNSNGTLVSKQGGANEFNYWLRPNGCAITTSENGLVTISENCPVEAGKTYHTAMVYDGSFLKFFRNGSLVATKACSGDLTQNDRATTIGQSAIGGDDPADQFLGFVGEVRIWKQARTHPEIVEAMNRQLINPPGQAALLTSYSFSDLSNQKNNGSFRAVIFGEAETGKQNPDCTYGSNNCAPVTVTAAFSAPDTICVNSSFSLSNASKNATSYRWSFCSGNNTTPQISDLGDLGGHLKTPYQMDYAFFNGRYYGFVLDFNPGKLTRLDFGASLLNTPTAVEIGNLNGALNAIDRDSWGDGGLQLVENQGKWYLFTVLGEPAISSKPRLLQIEFGDNLLNISPRVVDWGNAGNLADPTDLFLFKENEAWYGFVANSSNNSLTRFDFGKNFDQPPVANNLGTLNNILHFPRAFDVINDNGIWRMFVLTSGGTVVRLDFGNSLLNMPNATTLARYTGGGGPSGIFDMALLKVCNQYTAFAITSYPFVQLTFDTITAVPSEHRWGQIGPACCNSSLSRLFREGEDIYTFISNSYYTEHPHLMRAKISGCNTPDFPSVFAREPEPMKYPNPGVYRISLTVDEGLHTQTSVCKEVVVLPAPQHTPMQIISICESAELKLGSPSKSGTFLWSDGSTGDSLVISKPGIYWVETSRFGCSNRDSFQVVLLKSDLNLGTDTSLCVADNLVLDAGANFSAYQWSDGSTSRIINVNTPGMYYVNANRDGCVYSDTIVVSGWPKPALRVSEDTSICLNSSVRLAAQGGQYYKWTPSISLNNAFIENPVATPETDTRYYVSITDDHGCTYLDSTEITILPAPVFSVSADAKLCPGDDVQLKASGGDIYSWHPTSGLVDATIADPVASPTITTEYKVTITESSCNQSKTLSTLLTVLPVPIVRASKSGDIDCATSRVQLNATGTNHYKWMPITGLSDPLIANPIVQPAITSSYVVEGTDDAGCKGYDTIVVKVGQTSQRVYEVPSAFTPNNDGKNDCFSVRNWGDVFALEFSVYARTGEKVFFTNNPAQCWDGTFKGREQDAGIYVYIIKAKTSCTPEIFKKGTVMLVR